VVLRVAARAEPLGVEPPGADSRVAEVPLVEQLAAAPQAEPLVALVALGASANGRDRAGDPGIRSG
jgi:hypothetical protein